jgi:hypothetical protein
MSMLFETGLPFVNEIIDKYIPYRFYPSSESVIIQQYFGLIIQKFTFVLCV